MTICYTQNFKPFRLIVLDKSTAYFATLSALFTKIQLRILALHRHFIYAYLNTPAALMGICFFSFTNLLKPQLKMAKIKNNCHWHN